MRAGRLAGFVVLLAGLLSPTLLPAQEGLEVVKMVLAEPELDAGGEQLVQISLRNRSARTVSAGLRVDVLADDDRAVGIRRQRRVELPPGAETRVFVKLKAPARPGAYSARLVVFTPDFRRQLLPGSPRFFAPFKVTGEMPAAPLPAAEAPGAEPGRPATAAAAARRTPSFQTKPGLEFEKPDLLWENFAVRPSSLLIGEMLRIKADLRNVGGDIARNIEVRASTFNTRLPKRLLPFSSSTVEVLAPGEKIELEYEYKFPDDALLGDYQIEIVADPGQLVAETNEQNNRKVTDKPIRLSTILLVFPEAGFEFDQAGLFLFRWRSAKFDEFKVQVGTEPRFEKKENFFDLPQGEKWVKEQEIAPLAGELPGMLLGLMIKNETGTAYWRVVGRVAGTDKVAYSLPSPFTIEAELPSGEQQGKVAAPGAAGAAALDRPSGAPLPAGASRPSSGIPPAMGKAAGTPPAAGRSGSTAPAAPGAAAPRQ